MPTREMRKGVVKKVVRDKRFGFSNPDDSDSDIFVHNRCVHGVVCGHELFSARGREIEEGQEVLFQTEWDPRKHKFCILMLHHCRTDHDRRRK